MALVTEAKGILESIRSHQKLFADVEATTSEHVANYVRYVEQQLESAMRFEFPWGAEYCFPVTIPPGILFASSLFFYLLTRHHRNRRNREIPFYPSQTFSTGVQSKR